MTPRDELRELLWRAFCAGWNESGEGKNAEHGDVTDADLREEFDDWASCLPSLPVGGGDGRHLLRITLEDGAVVSELICPESGCEPVDAEGPPAPCWLRTWAENEDIAANYVQETAQLGTFAVEASFTGDQPNVRIVGPVSSSAGDGPERNGRNEKGAIGTAGDEAREALAHTIHRAIVLASAMTIQKAARGVYAAEMELAQHIAASLSSPLPGAGDGREWTLYRVVDDDGSDVWFVGDQFGPGASGVSPVEAVRVRAVGDEAAMIERAAATLATLGHDPTRPLSPSEADVYRTRARMVLGFALGYGRALTARAPQEATR